MLARETAWSYMRRVNGVMLPGDPGERAYVLGSPLPSDVVPYNGAKARSGGSPDPPPPAPPLSLPSTSVSAHANLYMSRVLGEKLPITRANAHQPWAARFPSTSSLPGQSGPLGCAPHPPPRPNKSETACAAAPPRQGWPRPRRLPGCLGFMGGGFCCYLFTCERIHAPCT